MLVAHNKKTGAERQGKNWRSRSLPILLLVLVGMAPLEACSGEIGAGPPGQATGIGGGGVGGTMHGGGGSDATPMGGQGAGGSTNGPETCDVNVVEPVTVRRLSHVEYARTIQDLLPGIEMPDIQFAPDLAVHGFENNAASLNPSAILVEQYNTAAVQLAERAAQRLQAVAPCTPIGADLDCARQFIESFGMRAFRRPLSEGEVERYLTFFDSRMVAISWNGALELTIQAFLQAPQFTYRLEFGVNAGATGAGAEVAPLGAYELASRLSYFLWQSMPDDALFAAAGRGELSTVEQVEAQARRMLEHARGQQAIVDFHRQWLDLDRVLSQNKDATLFPDWNDNLRDSLYQESLQTVGHLWSEGAGTLSELLTSNVSFVNGPVAALYGVEGVQGSAFQQVVLPANERSGILSRGAFLASRAHSTNGSPPLRGVAVLDRLLCAPPPPPPANADTSTPLNNPDMPRTNRELFDERTSQDACIHCHRTINGIGNAFEAFDSTGRFRTHDNGFLVDARGELLGTDVDGPLDGAAELGERLADSASVQQCAVRNWYRYAHAREDVRSDACKLDPLNAVMVDSGGDVRELIVAITTSYEFRHRPVAQ